VIGYDPTALLPRIDFEPTKRRRRAWTLAALGNRESWMKKIALRWPIERIGYPEKRIEESAVAQRYAETRGMIVPRYKHCRSGWWRPRYAYAAQTRTIAHVADDEAIAEKLPGYRFDPEWEEASDAHLDYVARVQAEAFERNVWPAEKFVETMARAMR
jgi:hypothetical protein